MIFLLCALSGVALGASAAPAADQYAAVKVHTLSTWYVSPAAAAAAAAAAAVSQPALAYTHSRSLFLSLFLWLANVTHRAHAVGGVFALVLGALLFILGMLLSRARLEEFSSTYITPLLIKRAPRLPPVHPASALAANFCAVDLSICNKLSARRAAPARLRRLSVRNIAFRNADWVKRRTKGPFYLGIRRNGCQILNVFSVLRSQRLHGD
jgi:hypothetical protein